MPFFAGPALGYFGGAPGGGLRNRRGNSGGAALMSAKLCLKRLALDLLCVSNDSLKIDAK